MEKDSKDSFMTMLLDFYFCISYRFPALMSRYICNVGSFNCSNVYLTNLLYTLVSICIYEYFVTKHVSVILDGDVCNSMYFNHIFEQSTQLHKYFSI